ncbi:MAG: SDR family oxidoreductase [Planctomycetota bacterium]
MDLQDRSVLLTGASRGLGAALAHELGRRGARLLLVARHAAGLEECAATLNAQHIEAHHLAADIADKDAIHRIAGAAGALLGEVDILVHNAGTLGSEPLALLADTACEDLVRAFEVNAIGPFRLTRALVGGMILRGRGLIAHISSDAAREAYPSWGAYGASKAALEHLARTWASELADTAVRSIVVDPGEMDTRMHAAAMPDADRSRLRSPCQVATRLAQVLADPRVANGARIDLTEAGRSA